MAITASKLRENIYKILDEAVETGVPIEVVRKGIVLRIVADTRPLKLSRLKKRTAFVGDPDDIFKIDWRSEWTALK
jgi:antitoxin (DNA-binding transcriptional repressor) of toxin-antitoxin stability system